MILVLIALWLKERRENKKLLQEFKHLFDTQKGKRERRSSRLMIIKLCLALWWNWWFCFSFIWDFSFHWLLFEPFPTKPEAKSHRQLVVSRQFQGVRELNVNRLWLVTELSNHIDYGDGWGLSLACMVLSFSYGETYMASSLFSSLGLRGLQPRLTPTYSSNESTLQKTFVVYVYQRMHTFKLCNWKHT